MTQSSLLIKDLPQIAKPREKMAKLGIENLTIHELIAVLLRTGYHQHSALDLAEQLLKKHGLKKLSQQSRQNLKTIKGIGQAKACTLLACFELAKRLAQPQSLITLHTPKKVFYQCFDFKDKQQELAVAFYLNGKKELLQKKVLSMGSFNLNFLEFRELLGPALTLPAASIVLTHNHPSGNLKPSQADLEVTQKVADACQLMGVDLIDHMIVGKKNYYSFRENGII